MPALVEDDDIIDARAVDVTEEQLTILTAGYEEGSTEEKVQKKIGEKFPQLVKAILAHF